VRSLPGRATLITLVFPPEDRRYIPVEDIASV
jgi:hypothetical protein